MPRRLTATERAEREYQRMLESVRNEVKRTLERDAQQLLGNLRQQLTQELQAAFSQTLQRNAGTGGSDAFASVSSLTRIVGSILRLSAKPRTSSTSIETTRSQDAFLQFHTSRSQSAADAGDALAKGERNL